MKKGEDTSMVAKRLSGQDLGYPCAITRRYTSSTQSRDALRVHPRTRHPLTPPVLFPSSHHPFPIVLSLPPPTNSYNYVHVPIYNPPSSSTLLPSNKVQHVSRCFDTASFSFLPSLSSSSRDRLEKNEGKVWGPDRYLYFSLI